MFLPLCQAAAPLHIDTVRSIHHDLRDRVIVDQLLKNVQPAHRIEQLRPKMAAVCITHTPCGIRLCDQFINQRKDLLIRHIARHLQLFHQPGSAFQESLRVCHRIFPFMKV